MWKMQKRYRTNIFHWKFIVCKNCLENFLSKVFNFRADSFKADGFLGVEYYTRPINIEDSYYIDDYEIIELLETTNIFGILLQKYGDPRCDYCEKEEEKMIPLKCGCVYCEDCLKKKVLEITKGLKVLNDYEKNQIRNTKCTCEKNFDLEEGLKILPKNITDKKQSLERLQNYVNTLCLICTMELRNKKERTGEYSNVNDEVKYKTIKMRKNENQGEEKDIFESDHLICERCYKLYLQPKIELSEEEEDEDNRNDFVDFENELIKCSICCRKHKYKDTKDGGCCKNDCIIY